MSKNKVDGKQIEQGYVSFGYNLQTVKNKKRKKNLADLERKTPSPQALPPAVGLKNSR